MWPAWWQCWSERCDWSEAQVVGKRMQKGTFRCDRLAQTVVEWRKHNLTLISRIKQIGLPSCSTFYLLTCPWMTLTGRASLLKMFAHLMENTCPESLCFLEACIAISRQQGWWSGASWDRPCHKIGTACCSGNELLLLIQVRLHVGIFNNATSL